MEFLNRKLEEYCEAHTDSESSLLKQVVRDTHLTNLSPRMLSGHLQGHFLSFISQLVNPVNALEIGTFTGYSALCLAKGIASGGTLHTIEVNEEMEPKLQTLFAHSERPEAIKLHIGNALDIIPTLTGMFDLVFIDADKLNYLKYYQLVIDRVRSGGVILADNVLWSGKIIDEKARDKDTVALREFNDFVAADTRVQKMILPLRDGLTLVRKK